jgi:hypothetical protein
VKLTDQQKDDLGAMTGFKEKAGKESQLKEMKKNLRKCGAPMVKFMKT